MGGGAEDADDPYAPRNGTKVMIMILFYVSFNSQGAALRLDQNR